MCYSVVHLEQSPVDFCPPVYNIQYKNEPALARMRFKRPGKGD